jgi:hypothetical protein
VIAEAARFPELGRTFYERGAGRTVAALAATFEHLARRDLLDANDPVLAATDFNWLVISAPVNQAMLFGREELDPTELDRYADGGVRAFLAAYGPKPPAVTTTETTATTGTPRRARTS